MEEGSLVSLDQVEEAVDSRCNVSLEAISVRLRIPWEKGNSHLHASVKGLIIPVSRFLVITARVTALA